MEFSASLMLIPFILLLLAWGFFSVIAIRQVLRFGFLTPVAVLSSCAYLAFSLIIVTLVVTELRGVDWSTVVTVPFPSFSSTPTL